MDIYFDIEMNGIRSTLECKTRQEAIDWAEDEFADECQREAPDNGEKFETEIDLIPYTMDDNGDTTDMPSETITIKYEHYHGDFAEHATY